MHKDDKKTIIALIGGIIALVFIVPWIVEIFIAYLKWVEKFF